MKIIQPPSSGLDFNDFAVTLPKVGWILMVYSYYLYIFMYDDYSLYIFMYDNYSLYIFMYDDY